MEGMQMTTELSTSNIRASAGKFLTFKLATETYGVAIGYIREILGLTAITAVPNTPRFIKGVTNLRGKIIPLIDLRAKLGMDPAEFTRQTCIVVVEVPGMNERILVGVIVDAVKEVVSVTADELDSVPSFGVRVNTSFLLGLANGKTGLSLLLDIERILTTSEIVQVEGVSTDVADAMEGSLSESGTTAVKEMAK
jgi:purine-binding chemotaxis protein CheW